MLLLSIRSLSASSSFFRPRSISPKAQALFLQVQKLEPQDYDSLVKCVKLSDYFQKDPSILEQMWFSDEALFHLSDCCNQHNTRLRGLTNPAQSHEHERDTPKSFVWCAVSSDGLIGPFFRDRDGHSRMLQESCVGELSVAADMQRVIFSKMAAQRIIRVRFVRSCTCAPASVDGLSLN